MALAPTLPRMRQHALLPQSRVQSPAASRYELERQRWVQKHPPYVTYLRYLKVAGGIAKCYARSASGLSDDRTELAIDPRIYLEAGQS